MAQDMRYPGANCTYNMTMPSALPGSDQAFAGDLLQKGLFQRSPSSLICMGSAPPASNCMYETSCTSRGLAIINNAPLSSELTLAHRAAACATSSRSTITSPANRDLHLYSGFDGFEANSDVISTFADRDLQASMNFPFPAADHIINLDSSTHVYPSDPSDQPPSQPAPPRPATNNMVRIGGVLSDTIAATHGGTNQAAYNTLDKTEFYKTQDRLAWRKRGGRKRPRSTSLQVAITNEGTLEHMGASLYEGEVQFRMKTQNINPDDGFVWLKYGEKHNIINHTYPRSYLRCKERTRSGCMAVKHIQRCTHDDDYVDFIYLARHNHSP